MSQINTTENITKDTESAARIIRNNEYIIEMNKNLKDYDDDDENDVVLKDDNKNDVVDNDEKEQNEYPSTCGEWLRSKPNKDKILGKGEGKGEGEGKEKEKESTQPLIVAVSGHQSGLKKKPPIIKPIAMRMVNIYKNNPEKISELIDFIDDLDVSEGGGKLYVEVSIYLYSNRAAGKEKDFYIRFIAGLLCAQKKDKRGDFKASEWSEKLLKGGSTTVDAIVELSRMTFSSRVLFFQITCEVSEVKPVKYSISNNLKDLFEKTLEMVLKVNSEVKSLEIDFDKISRENICKFVNCIFCDDIRDYTIYSEDIEWLQIPSGLKTYDPLKIMKRAEKKRNIKNLEHEIDREMEEEGEEKVTDPPKSKKLKLKLKLESPSKCKNSKHVKATNLSSPLLPPPPHPTIIVEEKKVQKTIEKVIEEEEEEEKEEEEPDQKVISVVPIIMEDTARETVLIMEIDTPVDLPKKKRVATSKKQSSNKKSKPSKDKSITNKTAMGDFLETSGGTAVPYTEKSVVSNHDDDIMITL